MVGKINILQIDVEDWYQNHNIKNWDLYEDRIVASTNKVLEILHQTSNQATFFVLGYVAEHFPELVLKIKQENHVVAKAIELVQNGNVEELGSKARSFVERNSWDTITDEFEKVLKEVIKEKRE